MDKHALETGPDFAPRFGPDGLIPAIAQDAEDGTVLMMAHMNAEALARTRETGQAHYYSRSRDRIWKKGERSGHVQELVALYTDCDQDVLLLKVRQKGPGACHVGYRSCFYRRLQADGRLRIVAEPAYDPDAVY